MSDKKLNSESNYNFCSPLPLGDNNPNLKKLENKFNDLIFTAPTSKSNIKDIFLSFWKSQIPKSFRETVLFNNTDIALESAIKSSIRYKKRMASKLGFRDLSPKIFYFTNSKHSKLQEDYNAISTSPPEPNTDSENEVLDRIETLFKLNSVNVAAFILNPIQTFERDLSFRFNFLKKLKKLCDQYQTLLIFDESNFYCGQTGTPFICQGLELYPHLVIFKVLPNLSGISSNLNLEFINKTSWDLDYLRAYELLNEQQKYLKNVSDLNLYIRKRLDLIKKRSKKILEIKNWGFYFSISFRRENTTSLSNIFKKNQILVNTFNNILVRFHFPLILSKKDIDTILSHFEDSLSLI